MMGNPQEARQKDTTEYRWANEKGAHSMPHPDELHWLGYEYVLKDGQTVRDLRYPDSVLMRRVG